MEKGKTYQLFETRPEDYVAAGPWILEIDSDGRATFYEAKTDEDGNLVKKDSTGISLPREESTGAIYLDYTINNYLAMYQLPETGGGGTGLYTMVGALLMGGAVCLLYSDIRRRKEESTSTS